MIIALIIKEFLAIVQDPKSRFVLIGPPIIQLFVFGYGASYDLNQIPIAIYDESNSVESRELLSRFEASPTFIRTLTLTQQQQIAKVLDEKKVLAVLHIGPLFSRRLSSDQPARLQILIDGRDSNTALIALNYMQTILADYNQNKVQQENKPPALARLQIRAWFNPNLESRWFIVTGIIGLLTLMVTVIVTALSVAREREQGTFDQLLVLTFLNPMRYFLIIVRGVFLEGLPIEVLFNQYWPLALMGFITLSLAGWLFRHRMV